jgi:ribosome-interacting GTPase 1
MPANLPPDYYAAEERLRSAESVSAKIECLEELISTVPKHKGTDHLRAELRRKLSRLKSEQLTKKRISKHESEYHIEKEGAARIILIGPPNVGKSALVALTTHATPKISESPFTTWGPVPGMLNVNDIALQLIDTPPLSRDFTKPELFDLIRTSDLILLMLDIQAFPIQQFEDSITLLQNHQIIPDTLDTQLSNPKHPHQKPILLLINKIETPKNRDDFAAFCEIEQTNLPVMPLSVLNQYNIEELGRRCIELLSLMRIYSKPPGKNPDLHQPYVLNNGATVAEFAGKVHRDFREHLKTARVWGKNVYDGQLVGRDHLLHDGDIVELHM